VTITTPVRNCGVLVAAMAVLGALAGVVWAVWSPPRPPGLVVPGGTETLETEQWIAADGRFALIVALLGLVFALVAWRARRSRGALPLLALAVGGVAGGLLTDLVGWLLGGGSSGGPVNTRHEHLRLVVHMHGLLFLEALVAVLVYGVLVAFAAEDDLGRPDPWHDPQPPGQPALSSVDGRGDLHGGGWEGDGPGVAQQGQFPPQ
jgi:hypothetical protein